VQDTSQHAGRALTDQAVLNTSRVLSTQTNLFMSLTYVPYWEGHGAVPPPFLIYLQSLCMPRRHIRGAEVQLHSFLTSALDADDCSASGPGNIPRQPTAGFEADYSQYGRRNRTDTISETER
jgi:hypothetical protein